MPDARPRIAGQCCSWLGWLAAWCAALPAEQLARPAGRAASAPAAGVAEQACTIPSPCSSIKLLTGPHTSGWTAEDRVGRAPALCLVSAGRSSPSRLCYKCAQQAAVNQKTLHNFANKHVIRENNPIGTKIIQIKHQIWVAAAPPVPPACAAPPPAMPAAAAASAGAAGAPAASLPSAPAAAARAAA